MYTLRIIEQKDGLETRSNFFLGKNYTVHCRVPLEKNEMRKELVEPLFETRLKSFVGEEDLKTMLTDDVVGFIVNDKEGITLFYKDQSVYIVNEDRKTLERVYGMYEKTYKMKNEKSKLKEEILSKISIMEQNTFLFPISWSEKIDMVNEEWSYKTYNSGNKGTQRYHDFEIYINDKKIVDIQFRGNSIQILQDLCEKQITLKTVSFYISTIFEEMHSFKNHNEGKRDIRKKINERLSNIERLKEEIKKLRQQLIDSDLPK